ncbi:MULTISPECIES: hypothetical protein [unclassified Rhizobium]|nr:MULTISPECIES: hypothetical protein [unclassified Rhizobium]MBO9126119.1 hypothetical protein [Rhizobium sp. 16-488-2b]MBO9176703.1 hypothetical protein [Rhizobium sp. 16-488-2a]
MTKIIGAAAILTIALATYAALNPYDTSKTPHKPSHQTTVSDTEHTASIR